MLTVEDVRDHRPERGSPLEGGLDQLESYLRLGAEGGVGLAPLEVVRRGIRLDLQRVVDSLVGPQAAH